MYEDLKKYITHEIKLGENFPAWYFKAFCERSLDHDLVKSIIKDLKKNRGVILDNEVCPFENMVSSFHMDDVFTHENTSLRLVLSCYTTDYELLWLGNDAVDIFYDYTSRGLKASGRENKKNILVDYFDGFKDFIDLFSGFTDEQLKEFWDSRNMYDINLEVEDIYMMFLGIIVDERKKEYADVRSLLDDLGFIEVMPGLFFYCEYTYNDFSNYDSLSTSAMDYMLDTIPIKTDLEEYSSLFKSFNLESSRAFEIMEIVKGNSRREIIF